MQTILSAFLSDPIAVVEFILAVVTLGYIFRLFLSTAGRLDYAVPESFDLAVPPTVANTDWREQLRLLARVGTSIPLTKQSLNQQRLGR